MSDFFLHDTHLQKLCYFTFILQSNLLVWVSGFIQCGFTYTETVWTIRDKEPRMSNSSFTQLLISEVSG